MTKPLAESTALLEATAGTDQGSGVLEVEFITPGWGSSGYYSRQVVEAAAPLFAVGTHMYFDHPTQTETADRPERSVRDLAAVITEAGTVDGTTGGIRGKVKPLAPYRELLTDEAFATNVGLSIRGSATDIVVGEAEGRTGPIVEGLAEISSVDFVTRAGRGGRVLAVLESANPEEVTGRAIGRGVAEATADERRQQLCDAVRTAYAGPNMYAWVRDFDDTTVWFDASMPDDTSSTWQQSYAVADDDLSVSLTGSRTEVRPVTKYVPVNTDPAGPATPSTPTTETQEVTMGNIQVDEAEHRRVTEAAGRVPTLESERDTAAQERDAARAELALVKRTDAARGIVAEKAKAAGVTFTALEERGLLADLPVAEDGTLDATNFGQAVDAAVTEATARQNTGSGIKGFGESAGTQEVGESRRPTANAWGRELQKGA